MKDFFSLKLPDSTPGQVIRAHRKNAGLTLKDLGEMTGIAESNLSAIEKDRRILGPEWAHILGAALGLDAEIILFPNGYKSEFQKKLDSVRARSESVFRMKGRNSAPDGRSSTSARGANKAKASNTTTIRDTRKAKVRSG